MKLSLSSPMAENKFRKLVLSIPQPRRDRSPSPGPRLVALTWPALQPAKEQMEDQGVETAEGFREGER